MASWIAYGAMPAAKPASSRLTRGRRHSPHECDAGKTDREREVEPEQHRDAEQHAGRERPAAPAAFTRRVGRAPAGLETRREPEHAQADTADPAPAR